MSAQPTLPTFTMPARYEAMARLGKGGGGEVWAVRDRVTGTELALKVLSEDAGEAEMMALVREAVTLSGLEGLGVPRVVAFGSLPGSARRYLVRELVDGRSLEDVMEHGDGEWLRPIACAADQLTVLHRAGLFHGDIKPANVIVGEDGTGTLVDLGLATPWREGGARAKGLTPKYAAPELLIGDALTVRGEVYALGATLADALTARGDELDRRRPGGAREDREARDGGGPSGPLPEHRRARERPEERRQARDARLRRGGSVAGARPRRRGACADRGGRTPRTRRGARGRRSEAKRTHDARFAGSRGRSASAAHRSRTSSPVARQAARRARSRRARSSSSSSVCGVVSTRPSPGSSSSSTTSRASTTTREQR